MASSVHELHRTMLTMLARDAHLPAVEAAARRHGLVVSHPPRTLRSRLQPNRRLRVELVVALGPRPRDALRVFAWPTRPDPAPPELSEVPDLGWVNVEPITLDPVAANAETLGGSGDAVTLVRYHPERRATVRIAAGHGEDQVERYAKVRSDDAGRGRHALAEELSAAAAAGRLGFRVPRPDRYDADRHTSWQHAMTGVRGSTALAGASGPDVAGRLGAALASLPGSDLIPARGLTELDLLARMERKTGELARLVPRLANRASQLLDRLRTAAVRSGSRTGVPVHGAPYPSQWLVTGNGSDGPAPGLLDFDRFSVGDPEHDVACFVAQVDAANARRVDVGGVNAGFLAGYQNVHGHLDLERLARYRSLQRLGKAVRSARSLRPDGDRRAEKALAVAELGYERTDG